MESRLYDTGYMNVMAYPNAVEAYRTDQIESITTMPAAAGNIWGRTATGAGGPRSRPGATAAPTVRAPRPVW